MRPWIAGIDVGARSTHAVVIGGRGIVVGRGIATSGAFFTRAAEEALAAALEDAAIGRDQIEYVASTGYGRAQVPFRDLQITEMTCHGVGALALYPRTRTVLDIGAQNTRVVIVHPDGRVVRFKVNDKCAAGAGRFLERVATAMEIPLADFGPTALLSKEPKPISSVCAVLAESEVINLVSQDFRTEDILLGVHDSIGERIVSQARQAGIDGELTLTGGLVNNPAMVRVLEQRLGIHVNCAPDGEFAGAIGAALLGRRRHQKRLENGAAVTAGAAGRAA